MFDNAFRAILISCLATVTIAPAAGAIEVAPGTTVSVDESQALPTGTKVAEKTIPFTLEFAQPGDEGGFSDLDADGTLTTSVYRNADTGRLSFVYDVFVEETRYSSADPNLFREPTQEGSRLAVIDFAGFRTDVTGDFGERGAFNLTRSADGSTLTGSEGEGLGYAPLFIIHTDAVAFDDTGTASYTAVSEFLVTPENDQRARSALVTLTGTYSPVVPEPAMAGLALACLTLLTRQRR